MTRLILASSSPRRQELIQLLNIPFEVMASKVDETTHAEMTPKEVVEELALRKASVIYNQVKSECSEGVIIGADTIVVFQDELLGKPADANEAFLTLKKLQGKTHQVYSGIAVIEMGTGEKRIAHRVTDVTMKQLNEREIKSYIQTGEPMDKAGSYGIQGLGALIVDQIHGDYYNVVGLSLALLSDLLKGIIDLPILEKNPEV